MRQRLLVEQQAVVAYANLRAAQAMASPFRNLHPGHLAEPLVELSPASPRYGRIVGQIAAAQATLQMLQAQWLALRARIQAIDLALQQFANEPTPEARATIEARLGLDQVPLMRQNSVGSP